LTDRTGLSILTFALARTVQTQYIQYRQTNETTTDGDRRTQRCSISATVSTTVSTSPITNHQSPCFG